jgi:hypothetical protein
MERRSSIFYTGVKYGVITALLIFVYSVFLQLTGLARVAALNWILYVILIVGIILGHYSYKANGDGYMTYGQGVGIGLVISFVTGLFTGALTYVYIRFVDDTVLENMIEQQILLLEDRGLRDAEIEQFQRLAEVWMSAEAVFFYTLFVVLIFGLIFSLVTSAITKKTNPDEYI